MIKQERGKRKQDENERIFLSPLVGRIVSRTHLYTYIPSIMRQFLLLTVFLVLQVASPTALHGSLRNGASTENKNELKILMRERVNLDKDGWRTAKYYRRPMGDIVTERFSVNCESKSCDVPSFEWKPNDPDDRRENSRGPFSIQI